MPSSPQHTHTQYTYAYKRITKNTPVGTSQVPCRYMRSWACTYFLSCVLILIYLYLNTFLTREVSLHYKFYCSLYTIFSIFTRHLHILTHVYQVQASSLFTANVIVNQTLFTVTIWQCCTLQGFINFLTERQSLSDLVRPPKVKLKHQQIYLSLFVYIWDVFLGLDPVVWYIRRLWPHIKRKIACRLGDCSKTIAVCKCIQ